MHEQIKLTLYNSSEGNWKHDESRILIGFQFIHGKRLKDMRYQRVESELQPETIVYQNQGN